jgi:hypothetical protein
VRVSRKSARGPTTVDKARHQPTRIARSDGMRDSRGGTRQPKIRLHTEEATGSIPVSPTRTPRSEARLYVEDLPIMIV